jgi:hypothetical protein
MACISIIIPGGGMPLPGPSPLCPSPGGAGWRTGILVVASVGIGGLDMIYNSIQSVAQGLADLSPGIKTQSRISKLFEKLPAGSGEQPTL